MMTEIAILRRENTKLKNQLKAKNRRIHEIKEQVDEVRTTLEDLDCVIDTGVTHNDLSMMGR